MATVMTATTSVRASRRAPAPVFAAVLVSLALAFGAGCGGCGDKPKSTRWDDAGAAAASAAAAGTASGAASAPAKALVPAGALNKYFPADGAGGYKRVFAADKEGYAEAKLQKDGKDVATISISDGVMPFSKSKLDQSSEKIDGFPVAKFSDNQSVLAVKDRFQVKVTSTTLDHDARKALLATFDLKGLSTL